MKKLARSSILLVALVFAIVGIREIQASTSSKIVYFYSETCRGCGSLQDDGYIQQILDADIEIIYIDIDADTVYNIPENVINYEGQEITPFELWSSFREAYSAGNEGGTPHMFVGGENWFEYEIKAKVTDGSFFTEAQNELLVVDLNEGMSAEDYQTIGGFLTTMLLGLLDGFNPCAIALLLMFISLLGFTENKKILTVVSVTYILTMFVFYFLFGVGILEALKSFVETTGLDQVVSWIMLVIVGYLLILNVYDFFVSRNEEYGKIKSQIPKWLQRFNSRIMKTFTSAMEDSDNKGNLFRVILLTFLLGFIMTLTEFTCSGFIYLGVLETIRKIDGFYPYLLLIVFNIMFVSPMIVISVLAIKSKSTMSISNWMRENMHIIKLFNAFVFLLLAVFIILRLAGFIS